MPKIPSEPRPKARPVWTTSDGERCRLYQGDCQEVLKQLPEGSVQCCVTSPPYFGLRDYGTATWEGGDEGCDHLRPPGGGTGASTLGPNGGGLTKAGVERMTVQLRQQYADTCRKCGARRIDAQLGLEKTPQEYVARMVAVFREVRRVLRDDGTLWLNLGDSYASSGVISPPSAKSGLHNGAGVSPREKVMSGLGSAPTPVGIKPKDLLGIPWRVAFALQDDGWYLRQDIIWAKPNPMPESVTDRCTKAHEYVFLLSKAPRYHYDAGAIAEPASELSGYAKQRAKGVNTWKYNDTPARIAQTGQTIDSSTFGTPGKRNRRSVWTVATQPYPGAHFATFPTELIRPMVRAGTSERGACVRCGSPWRRVVEKTKLIRERPNQYVKRTGEEGTGNSCPNGVAGVDVKTVGWEASCRCGEGVGVRPCVVLDPFMGSGTTALVALEEGRSAWGVDLSAEYLRDNAVPRIKGMLRGRPSLRDLVG